jgi:hypothetical protein
VRSPLPRRPAVCLVLFCGLVSLPQAAPATKAPHTPRGNPTIVLASAAGERTIPAVDLRFVYYERVYYNRHAPRSEESRGERTDVEDHRHECKFVRLDDWTKIKFSKVRQIEITYPDDGTVARLSVTQFDGTLRQLRADSLYGAADSFAPRFAARVDGEVREFPLILTERGSTWPEERLVRLLLKRPPPRAGRH